jgi:hypothetical protein
MGTDALVMVVATTVMWAAADSMAAEADSMAVVAASMVVAEADSTAVVDTGNSSEVDSHEAAAGFEPCSRSFFPGRR